MGLRFQKRITLLKGITLNLSKGGASVSVGRRARRSISARTVSRGMRGSRERAFRTVRSLRGSQIARWARRLSG